MRMIICDRLKEIREKHGMNKKEFADYLGLKYTTYNNYETGTREPASDFLILISKKFDVSIDYLLGVQDNKEILHSYQLKASEYDHMKKYRRLPDRDRELVDQHMDRALEVADQADLLQAEKQQLQKTVDQLQAELASREDPEEPPAPEYDHLTVIAAHNDHATEPGQLELMQQDVEMAKKLIAERRKNKRGDAF